MPRKTIDRTGKRYGKLTAIEHAGKRGYVALWRCKCDCGNEKVIVGANLQMGTTTSCGCARRTGTGSQPQYKRRLPPGEAALNYAYSNHKGGARDRKLEQALSREQFKALCLGNCFYCDRPPSTLAKSLAIHPHNISTFLRNGIDRWDNHKGYTPENCVSCCFTCNRIKKTMSGEEYLAYMDRLARHRFPGAFVCEAE